MRDISIIEITSGGTVRSVIVDQTGAIKYASAAEVSASNAAASAAAASVFEAAAAASAVDASNSAAEAASTLAEKQPLDATLTALAGVMTAADRLIYATAPDTFSTTSFTPTARSLLDDASTSEMRDTLGLSKAIYLAAGTNFDTLTTAGWYDCDVPVNAPSATWGWLEVQSHSTTPTAFATQTWTTFLGAGRGVEVAWTRRRQSGVWTPWAPRGGVITPQHYSALGDGTADDTAAIQSAISWLSSRGGGVLSLPAGRYKITSALTLPQVPISIVGAGLDSSIILQATAAADGLVFAATTADTVTGSNTTRKSITLSDFAILRYGSDGGKAINCTWIDETSNIPLFMAYRVKIWGDNDAGMNWEEGFHLVDAGGVTIRDCWVGGSPFETATNVSNPYTTTKGISLSGSNSYGNIEIQIEGNTIYCVGDGISIGSWYEGVRIISNRIVQVNRGVVHYGYSTSKNPLFILEDNHADFRTYGVVLDSVFTAQIRGNNLLRASHGSNGTTGYVGGAISLVTCEHALIEDNHIAATDTASFTAIGINVNCWRGRASGNHVQAAAYGISCFAQGWELDANWFYQCTYGIYLGAAGNHVGANNAYSSCTTTVFDAVGGNALSPRTHYQTQYVTFGSSLTTQTITLSLPSGLFQYAPTMVIAQSFYSSGAHFITEYERNNSTTSSAVVTVKLADGGTIAAGSYSMAFLLTGL